MITEGRSHNFFFSLQPGGCASEVTEFCPAVRLFTRISCIVKRFAAAPRRPAGPANMCTVQIKDRYTTVAWKQIEYDL